MSFVTSENNNNHLNAMWH